jgi:hypothetical protein
MPRLKNKTGKHSPCLTRIIGIIAGALVFRIKNENTANHIVAGVPHNRQASCPGCTGGPERGVAGIQRHSM